MIDHQLSRTPASTQSLEEGEVSEDHFSPALDATLSADGETLLRCISPMISSTDEEKEVTVLDEKDEEPSPTLSSSTDETDVSTLHGDRSSVSPLSIQGGKYIQQMLEVLDF